MENKDLKSIFMDSFSGLDEKLVKETEQAPRLLRKRRDGAVLIAFVCSLALILGISQDAVKKRIQRMKEHLIQISKEVEL